jgi:hypothetical protein
MLNKKSNFFSLAMLMLMRPLSVHAEGSEGIGITIGIIITVCLAVCLIICFIAYLCCYYQKWLFCPLGTYH